MGEYIELPGVKTWYEVEGEGAPILLMHGGFCTNETWGPQRADFAANHRVFLPERRAHGHTPDVEGGHFAERYRLFIIIALGESILVTGTTFAEIEASTATVTAFVVAFLGSVGLWWIYFALSYEAAH